jgi:Protein of unknown function (DUF4242)
MPRYLIERSIPGAGSLTPEQLHGVSARSNEVLAGMNGRAQWEHSYVTDDAITCVYLPTASTPSVSTPSAGASPSRRSGRSAR